jgi:hypothetical protein
MTKYQRRGKAGRPPARLTQILVLLLVVVVLIPRSQTAKAESGATAEIDSTVSTIKEYALTEILTLAGTGGTTDVLVTDSVSGLEVIPRSVTGKGKDTLLQLPQLPRGTFIIDIAGDKRSLIVTDQVGNSEPIDASQTQHSNGLVQALLLAAAATALTLLPRRTKLLAAGPLLLSGILWISSDNNSGSVRDWSQCDAAWAAEKPSDDGYFTRRDCQATYLLYLLETDDRSTLEQTLAGHTNFALCHDVTQLAGLEYLRRHQLDPELLERTVLPGCVDGIVHGAVAAWSTYRSDDSFMEEITRLCAQLGTSGSQRSCLHGLGHAALNRTNGDLYAAWDLCTQAPKVTNSGEIRLIPSYTIPEEEYTNADDCRGAVIMDWTNRINIKKSLSPSIRAVPERADMASICPELPDDGRQARILCYIATNFRNQNVDAAARFCHDQAPNRIDCFAALGHNVERFIQADGLSPERNILRHVDVCRGGGEGATACLTTMTAALKAKPTLLTLCKQAAAMRPQDPPYCG